MPSDEAIALAASERGLVIAPAGCGKTYLLAEAVSCSTGRQLVLTHTHSGVRAIRGHLKRHAVPSEKFRVITIDGFALRYASVFPGISGWTTAIPSGEDWKTLRLGTDHVLQRSAIRQVLSATYSGVFVDEYQDCSIGQHRLILSLAEFLPTRIVGDPLQAIFALLDRDDYCHWQEVTATFPVLGELTTPHRWNTTHEALGLWLLKVRQCLISGDKIDLRNAPVDFHEVTDQKEQARLRACFGVKAEKDHSIVALRKWRPECHRLARNLRGRFRAIETVECDELLEWSQRIETSSGISRVKVILDFAILCIAGLPTAVKQFGDRLAEGNPPRPRRLDYQRVIRSLEEIRDTDTLQCVHDAMNTLTTLNHRLVIARHELWNEMRRTLREHHINPSSSLRQTAWNMRNRLRHFGSRVDKAVLATPLLVKGLEFDHAVVLDANDHSEAESLYVAMTRGSQTLTIISDTPFLQRPKPHFVMQVDGDNGST